MTPSAFRLFRILVDCAKTWHELRPDFPDKTELNAALLELENDGAITWSVKDGLYHVTKAPRIAQDSRKTSGGMDVPPSEENAAQAKGGTL